VASDQLPGALDDRGVAFQEVLTTLVGREVSSPEGAEPPGDRDLALDEGAGRVCDRAPGLQETATSDCGCSLGLEGVSA
jgi:hypothetical protein